MNTNAQEQRFIDYTEYLELVATANALAEERDRAVNLLRESAKYLLRLQPGVTFVEVDAFLKGVK